MPSISALRASFACLGIALSGSAQAQVLTQRLAALGAPLSDDTIDPMQADTLRRYLSDGLIFGPLSVYGQATQGAGYISNADRLYGGRASPQIQTSANLNASLIQESGRVVLGASVDSAAYPSRTQQDRTNWTTTLQGYRLFDHQQLNYSYSHQSLNQMPTDLGALALFRPVPYSIDTLDVNMLVPTRGRLTFVPDANVSYFDYANIGGADQGLRLGYRNRVVVSQAGALRYALSGENALLAVLQGTEIRYTNQQLALPTRNSNGFAALGGYDYALPGPFRAKLLVGYQRRQYASALYRPIGAFYAEAQGRWVPTHLTQVSFDVSRGIADSAFEGVVGYVYTNASVQVRHLYARNLALGAGISVQHGKTPATPAVLLNSPLFQGRTTQTNATFNLQAEWSIDRHFVLGVRNDYTTASSAGTSRFSIDSAIITLRYTL